MGVYFYIYTGGEPLVRKKDLIRNCEKHSDCVFLCFTNSTLIDEEFADEMLRVGNFVPAISLEGFEEATDGRRGTGVYQKVRKAMELLRRKKLIYGISCCYTSANYDSITSEEFYDTLIEMGAYFVWYFHYMPVGNDAVPELMPTPQQRTGVYEKIRRYRATKPLFALDFQNDAEYVGGYIAGGHRYFSRLMKICFVRVLCWKILKGFVQWLINQEHIQQIFNLQKRQNIFVQNVTSMRRIGSQLQMKFGKRTGRKRESQTKEFFILIQQVIL